ncbi:AbrB family transcriptional regulator [Pseudooceanicola sediminis]|uniref:AbrB family transcriptional regulator n=2 Tax=Pseudooceanicola sediminis TaxID=2211117 RepID=A0A399IY40_9RHOB|nr:AbrB family transcriptional regulator [Pseudooceanicola sediminis]|tara:strand:- start:32926 stop:34050 length:1125 start_codon:yes stop_codon:yes gene_type:complete
MTSNTFRDPGFRRATARRISVWLALAVLSAALAWALELVHLPAALLLGPMIAAIVMAATGATGGSGPFHVMAIPRPLFGIAQSAIGVMIATTIPPETLRDIQQNWQVFLFGVVSVIIVSTTLGYLLAIRQVLPGATAIWGSTPGAAQAMVFLAEAHGSDMRLVAVMQYLRVGLVAAGASLVARFWVGAPEVAPAAIVWFPPLETGVLHTMGLMLLGVGVTRVLRIPAGEFLVPLLVGAAAQGLGLVHPAVPPWLLVIAFALCGWMIGLRFTREILVHAWKALPRLVMSIIVLMTLCGALAALLSWWLGIDPLTAYLATSPGGADSVAVIAASSNVDMAFVMSMQTLRFILVLISGPIVSRWFARRLAARNANPA